MNQLDPQDLPEGWEYIHGDQVFLRTDIPENRQHNRAIKRELDKVIPDLFKIETMWLEQMLRDDDFDYSKLLAYYEEMWIKSCHYHFEVKKKHLLVPAHRYLNVVYGAIEHPFQLNLSRFNESLRKIALINLLDLCQTIYETPEAK